MMKTRAVEVSGQQVEIHPIRWSAWGDVKAEFAELLGSRLVPEILSGLGRIEDGAASEGELAGWVAERIQSLSGSLGELLGDAVRTVDRLSERLIEGCVPDIDIAELTAVEALELAEASIEVSDLPGLLAREKNFYTAVIGAATAGMKTDGEPPSGT